MPHKRALKLEVADGIREVRLAFIGRQATKRDRVAWQEPPRYGTVCQVVWEDGGSNPASYPI